MDGKRSTQVDGLSKLTKIEELRSKLEKAFDVPPNMQRLFFRGKQVKYFQHTVISGMLNYRRRVCKMQMKPSALINPIYRKSDLMSGQLDAFIAHTVVVLL